MEVGSDVAQTLWSRWDDFWSGLRTFGLNEVKQTGIAFQEVADQLEQKRRRKTRNAELQPVDELAEFGSWLNGFVRARDELGRGVSVTLIGAEINQRHNCSPNAYAKRLGKRNLKALVSETDGIRLAGEGSDLFAIVLSKEEHERRRDMFAPQVADIVDEYFPPILARQPSGIKLARLNAVARSKSGENYRYIWGTDKYKNFKSFLEQYFEISFDKGRIVGLRRLQS